ncbi:MAG TPA: ATP-dependent DNA ligase, partial [Acidimicrobiia bacterium]|nr:ATP-dependent DNA ligase [Acidimicrobiia bacterium]
MLLAEVVAVSAGVTATSSRKSKISQLAALLSRLESDEIPIAVGFLSGEARQGRIGVGYASAFGIEAAPAVDPTLTVGEVDGVLA